MSKVPDKCPMCGEKTLWKKVDESNKGFSVGKAAVGAVLLGPVGLVGGALGNPISNTMMINSQFFSCLLYANFSCKVAFDYFYFFYWFYLTLSEHENTPI